jgi:steroid delta-isomerase-like uncharacterized protein
MSAQENAAAVGRARQQWNAGNLDSYLELYDPDIVFHGLQGVEPGIDSVRGFYQAFWAAFPGCQLDFEDTIAEGDRVAIRFAVRGTHGGDFQGIPATGKSVVIPGMTMLRFQDGKCVERWTQADFLGLLQQLGAIPAPAGVAA